MLLELDIERLGVVESARLRLGPGLTAVTGPTGAGKSLVAAAVGLASGARARSAWAGARVRALFRWPEEREPPEGVEPDPEGTLLVERELDERARSRVRIQGRLAPLQTLRRIGERLVDVLGQSETERLRDPGWRTDLVDRFGAVDRRRYEELRAEAIDLRARLDEAGADEEEVARRLDLVRHELDEIEQAAPRPGELEEVRERVRALAAARELVGWVDRARRELYEDEGSLYERLAALRASLDGLPEAPELREPLSLMDEAAAALAEAGRALSSLDAEGWLDPHALFEQERRLDVLERLVAKHGASVEDVLRRAEELRREAVRLERALAERSDLEARLERITAELAAEGRRLDRARLDAACRLARRTLEQLRLLGMSDARLEARLKPADRTGGLPPARGLSTVDLLLAANPGHPSRPLAEVASGGEAARIALATRAALADALEVPLIVFDEVESGVGARLGDALADTLEGIARDRQVLVVTHLAQVAARARAHFLVTKRGGRAQVKPIGGAERRREIAAMAGQARPKPDGGPAAAEEGGA